MKLKEAHDHPISNWRASVRPRRPYGFHRIELTTDPDDISPRIPYPDLEKWRQSTTYLLDGIWPHLSRLSTRPGESETILNFANDVGLDEFNAWAMDADRTDRTREAWMPIQQLASAEREVPHRVPMAILTDAWSDPLLRVEINRELQALRDAMETAAESEGADEALQRIWSRSHSYVPSLITVAEPIKAVDDPEIRLALIETPTHIFHRAWLELFDQLSEQGLPKFCEGCGVAFIGSRQGQRYHDERCRLDNAHPSRAYAEWRKQYDKMYKRRLRGTRTDEEFAAWQNAHPSPPMRDHSS